MVTTNPDKHIRNSVFNLINDVQVDEKIVKCFDTRVTGNPFINEYTLLTSQTKDVLKPNKCEYQWETSLLIEIYTKTSSGGNSGSRVLLNNIEQAIYSLLLPKITVSGFQTLTQNITFETQLDTVTSTEIIFRSFLRLNLILI